MIDDKNYDEIEFVDVPDFEGKYEEIELPENEEYIHSIEGDEEKDVIGGASVGKRYSSGTVQLRMPAVSGSTVVYVRYCFRGGPSVDSYLGKWVYGWKIGTGMPEINLKSPGKMMFNWVADNPPYGTVDIYVVYVRNGKKYASYSGTATMGWGR